MKTLSSIDFKFSIPIEREQGQTPDARLLDFPFLCYYGYSIGVITMNESEKNARPPLMATSVIAGFPSPAEQYIESPLDLNELLVTRPAATFFVRAAGDSMTGAGIHPNDILVVDRSLEAHDGSVVIASVNDEFTVKFLRRDNTGIRLEAANRRYKPILLNGEMELKLFGVVTAVIHRLVTPQPRS